MDELPDTVMLKIFSCLTKTQLCKVALVCEGWRRIAYDSCCWACTDLRRFRHRLDETKLVKLIRSRMLPLLRKLNLGGFTLSPTVFHILTKHCRALKVLCLETVTFVGDFAVCQDSFPTNLEKLDIRYCSGHPSAFRKIAQSLRSMTCLGLSNELFESLPLRVEVRDMFLQLREIRVLEFSYCKALTDTMVGVIAAVCTNLEALSMRRCNQITGTTLHNLIDSCSSLTSLVLDGTSLSDSALEAVDWERSVIREVDLSWCRHVTRVGLKFILPRLKHLQYLRLCCCGYGHAITDGGLMDLKRDHLKVLDLSHSFNLTDKGLGKFIAVCPSLRYLRIYRCYKITPAFMDLIPSESRVLVVTNKHLVTAHENTARDSLITARDSLVTARDGLIAARDNLIAARDELITACDGFRRCVSIATLPVFSVARSLDNEMD